MTAKRGFRDRIGRRTGASGGARGGKISASLRIPARTLGRVVKFILAVKRGKGRGVYCDPAGAKS